MCEDRELAARLGEDAPPCGDEGVDVPLRKRNPGDVLDLRGDVHEVAEVVDAFGFRVDAHDAMPGRIATVCG